MIAGQKNYQYDVGNVKQEMPEISTNSENKLFFFFRTITNGSNNSH